MQTVPGLHVSAKRDLVAGQYCAVGKWVSHLEGTPGRERQTHESLSAGRQVWVELRWRRLLVTRPAHALRAAPKVSSAGERLQTCLRSDRRLVLHPPARAGSSALVPPSARTRSCCCCCTRAREQAARPPARAHLSAPRRRGGAELSGSVGCHGGDASNIAAGCVNTTLPSARSGCQAGCPRPGSARSIIRDTAETRPSPPERALSGCRHASAIAGAGIATPDRNESVQRTLARLRRLLMIARRQSGMCLVRVCRSETTVVHSTNTMHASARERRPASAARPRAALLCVQSGAGYAAGSCLPCAPI